jgi:TctA family transporter
LLISFAGTLLGIAAIKIGIKRSHMMGFLVFPTILYFSGLTAVFSNMLGI